MPPAHCPWDGHHCRDQVRGILTQPLHQTDNIKDGIKAIEKALNIDDDGDTDMGGTTTGASEQNKDLLDRLDKIKDLWNEVGAWTNPLPAEWV